MSEEETDEDGEALVQRSRQFGSSSAGTFLHKLDELAQAKKTSWWQKNLQEEDHVSQLELPPLSSMQIPIGWSMRDDFVEWASGRFFDRMDGLQ